MENNMVTLQEEVVTNEEPMTIESLTKAGLDTGEIELAKKHGMIKEEKSSGEHEGEQKDGGEKDVKKESVLKVDDLDTFDKVHDIYEKDPTAFRELPKNIKGLYHNSKGLYKKAKTEEQRRQDAEKKYEYEALRNKGAELKLEKIRESLKKDNITVEEIDGIIGDKEEEKNTTPAEPDKNAIAAEAQNKIVEANKAGLAEYPDFAKNVELAAAVIKDKPRYQKLLQDALNDEDASPLDVANTVMDIARLHSDFGKATEKNASENHSDEKVDRMVKNANKKAPSAAVGSGAGPRSKTFDELTPEDVLRMSQSEYNKLPDAVRKRLREAL